MTLSVGQRIGKYVVTDLLGEGGMGVVFSAKHEALGRDVAIKLLHAEFSTEAKHVARFRQEAEAVSAIGHPHIVSIYDFGRTDDGALYYVMERIHGETLARRAQREPWLSPPEIVAVFGQIARALAAAHGRGIVHRDLKPENVILQAMEGGAVHARVLDFGISKMRDGAASAVGATQQGQILGTPAYMAPE